MAINRRLRAKSEARSLRRTSGGVSKARLTKNQQAQMDAKHGADVAHAQVHLGASARVATRRPKTKKGERVVKARAPQNKEVIKRALFMFGGKSSQVLKDAMLGLATAKNKEDVVRLQRRNDGVRPLEAGGEVLLEKLAQQWDCGLFVVATNTKKRPNNVTVGRLYDGTVYDILELGIVRFAQNGFHPPPAGTKLPPVAPNSKPMMVFVGAGFERGARGKLAQSILLDLFRGRVVDHINLAGLDRVLLCFLGAASDAPVAPAAAGDASADADAAASVLFVRHCAVVLKKSGQTAPSLDGGKPIHLPYVDLVEVGPSYEFRLGRHRLPPTDVAKEACRRSLKLSDAAAERKAHLKNTEEDELEGRVGRVFNPRQDLDDLQAVSIKRMAGRERRLARKERAEAEADAEAGADADADADLPSG